MIACFFYFIRIVPGKSLFDTTPIQSEWTEKNQSCFCKNKHALHFQSANTLSTFRNSHPLSLGCHHETVDYTSIIPTLDVTSEYVSNVETGSFIPNEERLSAKPLERWDLPQILQKRDNPDSDFESSGQKISLRKTENESYADVLSHWEDLSVEQRQDGNSEYISVSYFQSLSQADLESFSYFFPEDYFEGKQPKVQLTWPTPSGLTSANALAYCQKILENSTIGSACKGLLGHQLDVAIEMCLSDVQIKDDLTWAEAIVAFLENVCEKRMLEILPESFHLTNEAPANHKDIITALRCPNLCNGHGRCTIWGCQCFEEFSSHDCTVAKSE